MTLVVWALFITVILIGSEAGAFQLGSEAAPRLSFERQISGPTGIKLTATSNSSAEPSSILGAPRIQISGAILRTNVTGPPLQRAIRAAIEKLKASGNPYPTANFSSILLSSPPNAASNSSFITLKGITTLDFAGPADASKSRWDDLIIRRPGSGSGNVYENDFTSDVIGNNTRIYGPGPCPSACATYGYERRIYTIEENFTLRVPALPPAVPPRVVTPHSPAVMKVLMGFSLGQNIDWTIHTNVQGCAPGICATIFSFLAGLSSGYGIGLRLPASVEIDPLDSSMGEPEYAQTSLTPLDFSRTDYKEAGLPDDELFDGHEFEAEFHQFLGISIKVLGKEVVPEWNIDQNVDLGAACTSQLGRNCQDFVTPLGLDQNRSPEPFPFNGATITLGPENTGLEIDFGGAGLGVGLGVDFSLGSASRISGEWSAVEDAQGSGLVNYTLPSPTKTQLGPVTRGDFDSTPGHDAVNITLSEFKYFFSQLTIGFCADVRFTGWITLLLEQLIGASRTSCGDIFVVTLDVSGSSLDQHAGTPGMTAAYPKVTSFSINFVYGASILALIVATLVAQFIVRRRRDRS